MAQFHYKAMDGGGKVSTGTIEAVNIADLEMRLSRIGLDLIRAKQQSRRKVRIGGRAIERRDIIDFCFHMEQLTASGVPILDGLADLRDTMEHPRFREVIAAMIEAIEGGDTLSDAMASFPNVFDNVTTSLIHAGEQTGELPKVFEKLAESLKWQDEQIARTKKLIRYPLFVGSFVFGVVLFLIGYLVPLLVEFVQNMGQQLPAHTLVLIALSEFVQGYWYLIIGVPIAAFFVLQYLLNNSDAMRLAYDGFKLKAWIVGPLIKKTVLARFANYFSLMYASGITVLDAMQISEGIVGNKALAQALTQAAQKIADGDSITVSFESTSIFPPLVIRMLKVGETTGALDRALLNVGYFYSRDVQESIDRLQSMVEPAMLLFLASVMGWVVFSVMGPIYDLIGKLPV